MASDSCCISKVMTLSNRKLSALGAVGVPVAWWDLDRACQDHMHLHPSLQAAA